jgi:hypothetical protein
VAAVDQVHAILLIGSLRAGAQLGGDACQRKHQNQGCEGSKDRHDGDER